MWWSNQLKLTLSTCVLDFFARGAQTARHYCLLLPVRIENLTRFFLLWYEGSVLFFWKILGQNLLCPGDSVGQFRDCPDESGMVGNPNCEYLSVHRQEMQGLQGRNRCMKTSVLRCWNMHLKATMSASLPMVRLVLAKATRWWVVLKVDSKALYHRYYCVYWPSPLGSTVDIRQCCLLPEVIFGLCVGYAWPLTLVMLE